MISCLKFERTTQELVNAHEQFRNYSLARGSLGFGAATPCVQPESDRAVLSSHPLTLLKEGKIHNSVPAIFGTLRDEGKMFLGMFVRDFLKPLGLMYNSVFLTDGLVPAVLQALNVVIGMKLKN